MSAKVLAAIDERIGIGRRYAYEMLLDLARPWVIPLPTVAVAGNRGDRAFPVPTVPEYTECRLSHVGQLVLAAEAHRLAPVPLGLINGTTYQGGTQPPLKPSAVLAARQRLHRDGDLAALAKGRRVTLRESGQITITDVPVPEKRRNRQRLQLRQP